MSKKTKDTDGLCIAGFIVSLFSLVAGFLASIPGIILSVIGLVRVNKSKDKGFGLGLSGLIISVCTLIVSSALAAMFIVSWNENGSHREERRDAATREVRERSGEDDDEDDEDVPEDEDLAEWTVLVYMCGTDLESQHGFASLAFDWMDDEDITDDVNVIVETGGTLQWNNDDPYFNNDSVSDIDIPGDMLGRFKIEQGEVIDLGAVALESMGSADTLSDFITWAASEYPARKYMFVMWDHGYSEPYGNMEHDEIFFDDGLGGTINSLNTNVDPNQYFNDCLTLYEVREGFENGGVHFDLIAFNTCLSGSMEVASAIAPYADYMVGSEEIVPAVIGLPSEYITFLAGNPECTASEVGNEILSLYEEQINAYADEYSSDADTANMFATGTMSMIDLSAMEQIDSLMGDFYERLYYSTYNPAEFASIISVASKCENYGAEGSMPGNLIDLRAFLAELSSLLPDTSVDEDLMALIDSSVISVSGSARQNSHGMSIYFPSPAYPKAIRTSYESMLNANDIDYTEDEIGNVVQMHIGYAFDGYIDNIEFINGYYWYAAFTETRFSEYWSADPRVWDAVNNSIDPDYADLERISSSSAEEIEYELQFDDQGNISLNITSGNESVLSVESNICYYFDNGQVTAYTLFGSERVYPGDDGTSYVYNPNCEWINAIDYDITVFQIEDTDDHMIFATPADINGVWSFIYVYYDKTEGTYTPLYCAVIDPSSGVATNDIFYLNEGDVIEFMYYSVMGSSSSAPRLFIRGLFDPVEYDGSLDIHRGAMFGTGNSDKTVLVNFLIRDSFGNIIDTEAVEIVYGDDNEIVSVTEASGYIDYTNLYEVTTVWGN